MGSEVVVYRRIAYFNQLALCKVIGDDLEVVEVGDVA